LDGCAWSAGAVDAPVDVRPLQQLAVRDHAVELGGADEVIVPAVDLTRALLPGGGRDAEPKIRVERAQLVHHAALANTRRAGQDHEPAPLWRAIHSPPNSASNALR